VIVVGVLVITASRHDSSREIAEAIARGLTERGVDAEARPIDQIADLGGVDAVVVGSAIYMGRWLKPAREFVSEHGVELSSMPVWPTAGTGRDRCFAGEIASELSAEKVAR
jgi:menaquinone-dependent protoporphyrinogen oxidase